MSLDIDIVPPFSSLVALEKASPGKLLLLHVSSYVCCINAREIDLGWNSVWKNSWLLLLSSLVVVGFVFVVLDGVFSSFFITSVNSWRRLLASYPLVVSRLKRRFTWRMKSLSLEFCRWYVESRPYAMLFRMPGGWAECAGIYKKRLIGF